MSRRSLTVPLLLLTACSTTPSTRDVRVTILDEAGNPLPGAIFYAEAYDENGAFAFLSAAAGEAGVLPDQAREPLKIPWRARARLALAAFHPGYRPLVVRDPTRWVQSDGALLTLVSDSLPSIPPPEIAELSFPFEDQPLLARQLAAPEYGPLRAAFRRAWGPSRDAPGGLSPVMERKISTLDAIERGNLLQGVDDSVDGGESDRAESDPNAETRAP